MCTLQCDGTREKIGYLTNICISQQNIKREAECLEVLEVCSGICFLETLGIVGLAKISGIELCVQAFHLQVAISSG